MEPISSLQNVFQQSENELRSSLQGYYLPRDYQEIQLKINEHFTRLLSEDNKFISQLNASDMEYLNSILRMSLSFQKLSFSDSVNYQELSKKTIFENKKTTSRKDSDILRDTLSLLPTVVSAFFVKPVYVAIVGGATVLCKRMMSSKKSSAQVEYHDIDISEPLTDDMISDISESIREICQEIDHIIDKIRRDRSHLIDRYNNDLANKSLEKMYPQLLAGMQYLFMENIRSNQNNQNIENLIFQLGVYGYKVMEYSPENVGHFSQQVKYGIETPEMYLPAIVKENEDGTFTTAKEGILYIPQQ